MRLLHTTEYRFQEFNESEVEPYAILSHCWSQDPDQPELTYQKCLAREVYEDSYGWRKISDCCSIAYSHGLQWIWADTCCMDKTNSAELGETVNSMFRWYQQSAVCYVLMDDVSTAIHSTAETRRLLPDNHEQKEETQKFCSSRWFRRGWTLQELLAPTTDVLFYNRGRELLGTRSQLADLISTATGIDLEYVTHEETIHSASIAQRMSWASARSTTRIEDMAYSLLGIFNVNMPLIYGEGRKAFLRLQRMIIDQYDDDSIFAWGLDRPPVRQGFLANSPCEFAGSGDIIAAQQTKRPHFEATKAGILYPHMRSLLDFPFPLQGHRSFSKEIDLACRSRGSDGRLRRVQFTLFGSSAGDQFYRSSLTTRHLRALDEYYPLGEARVYLAGTSEEIGGRINYTNVYRQHWVWRFGLRNALCLLAVVVALKVQDRHPVLVCMVILVIRDIALGPVKRWFFSSLYLGYLFLRGISRSLFVMWWIFLAIFALVLELIENDPNR